MAPKPTKKPSWVPSDNPLYIDEPSAGKKLLGWVAGEKPPFQWMNWLFNVINHWVDYFAGAVTYNIVIDTTTGEGDFSTLAAYLAGSPAAGDRVWLKVDENITAKMTIPAGILIRQLKGKKLTTSTNLAEMLELGIGSVLEGDFLIETSHTGIIGKAVILNGNGCRADNIIINNTSTGTITNGVYLAASKNGIKADFETIAGTGTITTPLNDDDNSETANLIQVRSL